MRKKYLDHSGLDSLPHLRIAAANKCDYFITNNKKVLADRAELEEAFDIYIKTTEEMLEIMKTKDIKEIKERKRNG